MEGRIPHGRPPAQAPRAIPSGPENALRIYQRQRLAVLALVALFLAVVGMLGYSYSETRQAHAWVTRTLELEMRVTSVRFWIDRGSNEVLAAILGDGLGSEAGRAGDQLRARTEIAETRALVADDPAQVARVDELERLVETRFAIEQRAAEASRTGGPVAARDVLAASGWAAERDRIRSLSTAMLADALQDYRAQEDRYAVVVRRVTVALFTGVALMVGTLLYLLQQLQVAQRARDEAERAKELARERLSDLEGVLDAVPAAVYIAHDRDCLWIDGNRFAVELMRAAPGANISQSAPAGSRPPGVRFLRNGVELEAASLPVQVAASRGVPVNEAPLELAFDDGTVRHLLGRARPLLDASGAPRGAVGAFVDVTEPVRVARELRAALEENRRLLAEARRSELLHREMARNFPNGAIALFDRDLRFLVFDGSQFALPRDPSASVGRTLAELFPPELAGRLEPVHRGAVEGKEGRVEVEIAGRMMEIRASPVRDETGAVIMGIAVSQDVTEERSLRTQLAVSSRLASLGTLVAGVAHEVNNPLAGTLASLATALEVQREVLDRLRERDGLDREALAAAANETVEILLDAQVGGDRIARIVKDLALFGRPNPMRTRVRLGDVVTASMRWLPSSVGRVATVQVDDLGAPDVHASAGQLEQVIVNLVNNAASAIPEGRRGRVGIRLFASESGRAVLEVTDDGRGIPPSTMERIFDPFFTTREVGQGMGLGLPICHAIVAAHGGTLTASSVPGEGATFRVELPAVE
jgi:signal transduction histidine kinase/CHASE3 domain sensor protein